MTVGCLNAPDCTCKGRKFISVPIDWNKDILEEGSPTSYAMKCPGPTDAEYGHIIKARKRLEKEAKERIRAAETNAKEMMNRFGNDPEQILMRWADSPAKYYLYALVLRVKELEAELQKVDYQHQIPSV